MAQQVNAWADIHGKLFLTEAEAKDSDKVINRLKKVEAIVDSFFCHNITENELVEYIIVYRKQLLEALK